MEPIITIQSTAIPVDRSDVDTDQIIPAEWLKRVERTGFGEGLFAAWRKDASFPLNDKRFTDAQILIAGPNFGTGSSREHAVWALTDYGFKAVISPRFGDIFRNNSTKAGLVPVQVSAETGAALMKAVQDDPTLEIIIDIASRTVGCLKAGIEEQFPLDDFTQMRFLEGLDDIGLTLRNESSITTYEQTRKAWLPSVNAS